MHLNELDVNKFLLYIREGNLTKLKAFFHAEKLSFLEGWSQGYTLLRYATKFAHAEIAKFLLYKRAEVNSERTGEATPLHFAVASNEVNLVKMLINYGADVNALNSQRETPLHWAVRGGNKDLKLVQMLINGGALISAANSHWETPLHVAVESGNVDVVQLLCNKYARSKLDISNFTPLHIACFKRFQGIVEFFLNKKRQLGFSSDSINTALLIASKIGEEHIVSLTLVATAVPNECLKSQLKHHHHRFHIDAGSSPLFEACENGHLEVVKLLLRHGAKTYLAKFFNKYTPLHVACEKSFVTIVDELLRVGANPNYKASDGTTPLHLAAQNGSLKIVKSLLKNGAHPNCSQLPHKFTPLHLAVRRADLKIVNELLQSSADVNVKASDDMTSLHLAAGSGCLLIVHHLLDSSADINAETCKGSTPLHVALENRDVAIVECLLKRGADIKIKDENGDDSLYFAVKAEDAPLIGQILQHKPNVSTKVFDSVACSILNDFGNNQWIYDLIEYSISNECEITHYGNVFSTSVKRGLVKIVKTLLWYGVRLNNEGVNLNLLHEAVKRGHTEIVELLLKYGWSVNAKDSLGNTPIHYFSHYYDTNKCTGILQLLIECGAIVKNSLQLLITAVIKNCFLVCKELIRNGVDVNFKNENSQTALQHALIGGLQEIAKLLIISGADINSCDENGTTPLHLAIKWDCQQTMRLLLKSGANINLCQKDGHTPLHIASDRNDVIAVNLLLGLNVDINALTGSNETALHLAARNSSLEIIGVLLDNGIDVNVEDSFGQTALDYFKLIQRVNILKRHIIKLKVAGFDVLNKFKCDLSDRYDAELPFFDQKCEEEIEQMKCQTFFGYISLFDVLKNQRNPTFARNESLMEALTSLNYKNFPIYQSFIENCLEKSKERIDLLTSGQKWLNALFKTSNLFNEKKSLVLPAEILDEIVSLLNNRELRELIICGEDLKRQFTTNIPSISISQI